MLRSASRAALLVALAVWAAAPARGDEPALVADRPGFGESASAVPPGHVQLEGGVNWTRVDAETTTADGPELLLRVGALRSLELRVAAPGRLTVKAAGARTSGWTDVSVGVKSHLSAGSHDLSLRGTVYLPSGSPGFSSDRSDPELAVAWSHPFAGAWSVSSTVSERWLRLDRRSLLSPSVSLGRALGARGGAFVEYGATVGRGGRPLHRLDHGYTWHPSPRTQLDVSAGVALSVDAPDFFVGAGLCRRF